MAAVGGGFVAMLTRPLSQANRGSASAFYGKPSAAALHQSFTTTTTANPSISPITTTLVSLIVRVFLPQLHSELALSLTQSTPTV